MCGEVTLQEVLAARDARAARQKVLLEAFGKTVISFCLNIAGPVKNSPLIRRTFDEGLQRLTDTLTAKRFQILHQEQSDEKTGCEALLVTDGSAEAVKRLCMELEDADPLGRLFDMDVLTRSVRWDRHRLGFPDRPCIVCGQIGKGCASRRLHPVEELQKATHRVMAAFFARQDEEMVAGLAAKALLYEVCTTPKPGLVDRQNNGSHRDMDLFTFLDSTAALLPYYRQAFSIGRKTAGEDPAQTFLQLRREGLRAERAMLRATVGVNTHKGAIYSLGIVCAAAGRLWQPERPLASASAVLEESGRIGIDAAQKDFCGSEDSRTAGERVYRLYGLRGIRGEVADGLPSVREIGLPALQAALLAGATLEQAGVSALLCLMAHVTDTNLIARGGLEGQRWTADAAASLEATLPDRAKLEEFDRQMIQKNLSPGGCADLLAITYFLYFYSNGES